ncbi:hypothetical protein SeLEV6574_g05972 [Synchytrium endobioticum]|nr:hypothetical protein SeLEV6574_g05972 [Synchytrium endobioticum]
MPVRGRRQNVKFQPLVQPRITMQVQTSVNPIHSSLEAKFKQVEQARKQSYQKQNKNSRFVAQMVARTGVKPSVDLNTRHSGQPPNQRGTATGRGRGGARGRGAGGRRVRVALEGRLGGKNELAQQGGQQRRNFQQKQRNSNEGNSISNISQRGGGSSSYRGKGRRGGAGTAHARGRGGAGKNGAVAKGREATDQAALDAELEAYMLKDADYAAHKLDQDLDSYMNMDDDPILA